MNDLHLAAAAWVAMSAICAVAGQSPALPAGSGAGTRILSESSVWRTHVTWSKALIGTKPTGGPDAPSSPPPDNWTAPDFDDSGWGPWSESHAVTTLKTKDGKDTGVRLYDYWQYGVQLSPCTALRCLRGKFVTENPDGVKSLTLSLAYRGGVVVYVNGKQAGRSHVTKPAAAEHACPAEAYPDEIYFTPEGKPWRLVNTSASIPSESAALEHYNKRIRTATLAIPPGHLRKGVNVLAIEIHRSPYSEKAGREGMGWGACGIVSIDLRAEGPVVPAVGRPHGLQVWNASILNKPSLFGSMISGRWGQGAGTIMHNYPLSWANACDPLMPLRIVGARNGTFNAQVVVSADCAIRNLRAAAGELAQVKGSGRIPASACQIRYMGFPENPPESLQDPAVSMLDVLHEQPLSEVVARTGKEQILSVNLDRWPGLSWSDSGALAPVWLSIKVPANAAEGDYEGTLTVSAEGMKQVTVPVKLTVQDYVLPDPRDLAVHTGLMHSPDTLALKYKVPVWSDRHFKLMDRTLSYMEAAGGGVVWIPLVTDTLLGNRQGMVRWVKQADGGYVRDYAIFDRYLDMVQRRLKPEAVNVCVFHPVYTASRMPKCQVSTLDAAGKESLMEGPAYAPGAEAEAFWKPVIAEIRERLKKRNLPDPNLGLVLEQGWSQCMPQVVDLFKAVWPEGKWAQLAHYGGSKGGINGVPYGYVMSVWGSGHTPWKVRQYGAPEIPCIFVEHFRADRLINIRPISWRGTFYLAAEASMGGTQGIGPLGMDFWNLTGDEGGWQGGSRSMEGMSCNLSMSAFTTAAFLAPGPDGPLSTARFEIFREGLQIAQARAVIEKALKDAEYRARLGEDLVKACEAIVKEREQIYGYLNIGEPYAEGEGWKWFETCGWEDIAGRLFDCAGRVSRISATK